MNELSHKIESLLFLEPKPFSVRTLAKACGARAEDVTQAVQELQQWYAEQQSGVALVQEGDTVQLMTSPQNADFVRAYLEAEETGELTRPSLETLTIIAYRGPVSKTEIELIRGVNCSLILRNLLIRGLAEEDGETETGSPIYRVTLDFLRTLGVTRASELPHYQELNQNVHLAELLAGQQHDADFFKTQQHEQSE